MPAAFINRCGLLSAVTVALVAAACQPKEAGESSTGSATDTTGPGATDPGTTGAQECTPGDEKFGEGDCETCVCSEAGTWLCNRCDPTGPPIETTDATTGSTGDTGTADTSGTTSDPGGETTGGLVDLPSCDDLGDGELFNYTDPKIVGDELVLTVDHFHGCEDHEFKLCIGGISDAVVLLGVRLYSDFERCEMTIEDVEFDLTPLQAVGPSPVTIQVQGLDAELQYVF